MEATGDLPPAADTDADPSSPPPDAVVAMSKAQRCLWLAPPPRPAAATTTVVPDASNGLVVVASIFIPHHRPPCRCVWCRPYHYPPRCRLHSEAEEATAGHLRTEDEEDGSSELRGAFPGIRSPLSQASLRAPWPMAHKRCSTKCPEGNSVFLLLY
ncbi:hypothetical protein ZWY2020_040700 [Hordeum vulgare]|nr:hypothetical protein ZWY2020_040700 [Hordeum vulgare]